jgi:hypothetical protein
VVPGTETDWTTKLLPDNRKEEKPRKRLKRKTHNFVMNRWKKCSWPATRFWENEGEVP